MEKRMFIVDSKQLFPAPELRETITFFDHSETALEKAERMLIERYTAVQNSIEGILPFHDFEIFKGLQSEELSHIEALLEMQSYKPEETIVKQGTAPEYLYLLCKGTAAVYLNEDRISQRIRSIHAGVSFGELAILNRKPRSADVISDDYSTCYLIAAKAFYNLEEHSPALFSRLLRNLFDINIELLHLQTQELAAYKGTQEDEELRSKFL